MTFHRVRPHARRGTRGVRAHVRHEPKSMPEPMPDKRTELQHELDRELLYAQNNKERHDEMVYRASQTTPKAAEHFRRGARIALHAADRHAEAARHIKERMMELP